MDVGALRRVYLRLIVSIGAVQCAFTSAAVLEHEDLYRFAKSYLCIIFQYFSEL